MSAIACAFELRLDNITHELDVATKLQRATLPYAHDCGTVKRTFVHMHPHTSMNGYTTSAGYDW